MRTILFFFLFSLTLLSSFGQTKIHQSEEFHVSRSDSVEVFKTWDKYALALGNGNTKSLTALTQATVDCHVCDFQDQNGHQQFVPADTLFNVLARLLHTTNLGTQIKSKPAKLRTLYYEDFQPPYSDLKPGQDFTIYQISIHVRPLHFDTLMAIKHKAEGAHIFQFIKRQDRFILYGFDTAP